MASKHKTHKTGEATYRSFEQWRADLFPNLVDEDRKNIACQDANKLGTALANESFERLLKSI